MKIAVIENIFRISTTRFSILSTPALYNKMATNTDPFTFHGMCNVFRRVAVKTKTDGEVPLTEFLDAFRMLNKLFIQLGPIFYFVKVRISLGLVISGYNVNVMCVWTRKASSGNYRTIRHVYMSFRECIRTFFTPKCSYIIYWSHPAIETQPKLRRIEWHCLYLLFDQKFTILFTQPSSDRWCNAEWCRR